MLRVTSPSVFIIVKTELVGLPRGTEGVDAPDANAISWVLTTDRGPIIEKQGAHRDYFRRQTRLELFEELILPHLDAAHNLARWLTRSEQDAQDVVQEAYLRAFGYFDSYRGGDGKAWLLAVVRNTCRTWQRLQSKEIGSVPFDEGVHGAENGTLDHENTLANQERIGVLKDCIESLPVDFREVLIMRELEEMSY